MASTTILEVQTLAGFADSGDSVSYMYANSTDLSAFTINRYYVVSWDGTEYRCVAKDVDGVIALGNEGIFGGTETPEPFLIGILSAESTDLDTNTLMIYTTDITTESHAIGISDFGATADGIVLKNYSGVDVGYDKVDAVMFNTPDGGTQVFSKGEAISGVALSLDLAEGDQTVIAPEGTLVQSAIIRKPESLLPENIRYGVDIAGVEGEFLGDPEERTVDLEMATGDLVIEPSDEGKTMTKVTVTKPDTLVPENIKYGVTIAGIEGECGSEGEEITVDLDMETGDMVITPPTEGKTMTQVTVTKPDTLAPENILLGVNIGGVVGTYVGSGSGDGTLDALFNKTIVSAGGSATVIPNNAFQSCKSLTSLNYPLVSSIGNYAFQSCTALSEVSFPACKTISTYAFSYCSALTSMSFPACTTIGTYAFGYCSGLTSVEFPACLTINGGAFYNCSKLMDISFPACTYVGANAFQYCYSLTSAIFPAAKTVGTSAFAYCSSMLTADFPKATTVSTSAFIYCSSMTSASFPLCTSMSSWAFNNCKRLWNVYFPKLTVVPSYAFSSCAWGFGGVVNFDAVQTIQQGGFWNINDWKAIKSTFFPVCTTVGSSAFAYNYYISYAYLPAAKVLSSGAFYSCSRLAMVSLPAVSYIYASAFYSCGSLMSLYLLGSSYVTLTTSYTFRYTPMQYSSYTGAFGSIFVPSSMLASYKTRAYWSYYSNRFVGLTDEEIAALEVPE